MMRSKTIIAIPPGATIKEQLIYRGMSQKEFALRMGMSEKHISRLINGEVKLTMDVAVRLETVLGVPASFWNNLESTYREKLLKIQEENNMEADKKIAKQFPYNDMAKNGWVETTRKSEVKVINLRKFFEVARLGLLSEPIIPRVAYRKLGSGDKSEYALIAWAQKAKLEARKISTSPISISGLEKLIPLIRKMTLLPASLFCQELRDELSKCGIALVFLQHIERSFLHGATFYDGSKIVIGMTFRGKDTDRFWFSLFHEFAHIIYGHIAKWEGTSEDDERNADIYARNTLIPEASFNLFVDKANFDEKSVVSFANEIGIAPGIVVGRLQNDGKLSYKSDMNRLKGKICSDLII